MDGEDRSSSATPSKGKASATKTPFKAKAANTPLTEIVSTAAKGDAEFHQHVYPKLKDEMMDAESILELEDKDYDGMGIKKGARARLQRAAKSFLGLVRGTTNIIKPSRHGRQKDPPSSIAAPRVLFADQDEPRENLVDPSAQVAPGTEETTSQKTPAVAAMNPNDSTISEEDSDEELFRRLELSTHRDVMKKKTPAALKNLLDFRKLYNQHIKKDGSDWQDERPDKATLKAIEFIKEHKTWANSSKLAHLDSLSSLLNLEKKTVRTKTKNMLLAQISSYKASAQQDQKNNTQNANRPIGSKDVLHLINSMIENNNGVPFSLKQILAIWKLVFGRNSSRRHIEFPSIAPCSIGFRIVEKYRILNMVYVLAKRRGVSTNEQSIASLEKVQDCPVVWTLMLLQALGAIDSAVDVYDGKEKCAIDPAHFESITSLGAKFKSSIEKLTEKQIEALESGEDKVIVTLFDQYAKDHPGDLVPIFPALSNTHSLPTSKPMSSSRYNALLGEQGARHGYIVNRKTFFGTTGAHKGFIGDGVNSYQNAAFDMQMHQTIHADHTALVNRTKYRDDNAYKRSLPANLGSVHMPAEQAEAILANFSTSARYEYPECFQTDWKVRDDPLPSPRDFMLKYASSPKLFGKCDCPVVGCEFVGRYQEDLMQHMKTHGKTDRVQCPGCSAEFSLSNYKANHVKQNGNRTCNNRAANPMIFDKGPGFEDDHYAKPPESVCALYCSKSESCSYWNTSYFRSHLDTHKCKIAKVKQGKKKEDVRTVGRPAPQCVDVNPDLTDDRGGARQRLSKDDNEVQQQVTRSISEDVNRSTTSHAGKRWKPFNRFSKKRSGL